MSFISYNVLAGFQGFDKWIFLHLFALFQVFAGPCVFPQRRISVHQFISGLILLILPLPTISLSDFSL